jgi:hypothetical protein
MANTVTFIATSRTPLSVVLSIANDGQGGAPVSFARASVLSNLLPGPLQTYLAKLADWTTLDIPAGPIRMTTILNGALAPSPLLSVVWLTAPNSLAVAIDPNLGAQPSGALLEIRLSHSKEI